MPVRSLTDPRLKLSTLVDAQTDQRFMGTEASNWRDGLSFGVDALMRERVYR